MSWGAYIEASISELLIIGGIGFGIHVAVYQLTGVHMLDRAISDFQTHPVPQWTWPTWTIAALAMTIAVLAIVYHAILIVAKKRGQL